LILIKHGEARKIKGIKRKLIREKKGTGVSPVFFINKGNICDIIIKMLFISE